jgi:nucleotide-binding universal stress UspA family protein
VSADQEHLHDGPSTILAAVDGSVTSLRAGAYAAGLARRQRARLVVVHVASLPALAGLASGLPVPADDVLAAATEDVRRQVAEGAAYSHMAVEFVPARGDAFSEIRRVATEYRVDAVVVGTSTKAGHRIVGSLAVRLVRAGLWPVTVVP